MSRISIDDTNTTLITYQGDWSLSVGSSRQWNSTVHSTLTPNSSATFRFRGYQVWIWGTIPAGSGSNSYGVSVDGSVPNITSRASNGSANFEDSFYESPLLTNTYHEIVVTNEGSNANGNTEFMLDRFEFETMDETPLFTTSGFTVITSSTTSSFSSATSTAAQTTSTTSEGGKKTPVAAIAGAVIAVLVVVIAVLGYLLWRKSRKNLKVVDVTPTHLLVTAPERSNTTSNGSIPRNPLLPIPYQLDSKSVVNPSVSPADSGSLSRELQMSQKSGYQNFQQNTGMLASTSSLIGGSPVPAATTSSLRTSSSNRDDQSRSPSSPNDGSLSSMYYNPNSPQRPEVHQVASPLRSLPEVVSTAGDHTELPPPSYSRDAVESTSLLSNK